MQKNIQNQFGSLLLVGIIGAGLLLVERNMNQYDSMHHLPEKNFTVFYPTGIISGISSTVIMSTNRF